MPQTTIALDNDIEAAARTFLVGDIGGTNCRFALARRVEGGVLVDHRREYRCAEFPTAADAIDAYLGALSWTATLGAAVLAVAGPVQQGVVQSTNMPWRLSEADLRGHGARVVKLINDYTALCLAADHFGGEDWVGIGPDLPGEPEETVAIIGAGTGFGAGALARGIGGATPIATEGGHMSFAPVDDVEAEILAVLRRRFGRVSVERLLSGPGLVNIRTALAEIDGELADAIESEDMPRAAAAGDDLSRRALDQFCAIYGSVAGDMALAYGARGGVYLGGGIAPALAALLQASRFRQRFEDKGRFRDYLAAIPTRIIVNVNAALVGAGALAARVAKGED